MPQYGAADLFVPTLGAPALAGDATLTLSGLTGAPSYPYKATLTPAGATFPPTTYEIVYVTGLSSGNVVNVLRGQEGTTAQGWSTGDNARNEFTAVDVAELLQGNWPPDFRKFLYVPIPPAGIGSVSTGGTGAVSLPSNNGNIPLANFHTGATAASYATVGSYWGTSPYPLSEQTGNGVLLVSRLRIDVLPAVSGDQVRFLWGNPTIGLRVYYNTALHTELDDFTGSVETPSTVAIADTNWHTVALHVNTAGTYLYIDGVLAASGASRSIASNPIWTASTTNGSASTTDVNAWVFAPTLVQAL